ncbi:hypothetical protein [Bacillus sp. EB600]|uniref:hypothetical protein n=1 Tax=Bacillus sp. EB600 TaxID=2806345 RepID=UPI00210B0708|nr:hypothetical protein [Bacillus sp. EB600]MCQ6280054.1 hypothetical protein [Bacillus sp. EB600]
MTDSNEKKQPQKPNDKQTINRSYGRPANPTRRPKPKSPRTGLEYITTDSIKGFLKKR